jgi:hypothetical protein
MCGDVWMCVDEWMGGWMNGWMGGCVRRVVWYGLCGRAKRGWGILGNLLDEDY